MAKLDGTFHVCTGGSVLVYVSNMYAAQSLNVLFYLYKNAKQQQQNQPGLPFSPREFELS